MYIKNDLTKNVFLPA